MSLPHVLLGLLSRGVASGWDLRARLARDGAAGWDADLAQIYPALARLLRGGFVAMRRRRSTRGPARREYRLTPSGRHELLSWHAEPAELPRLKHAALARLAFLERLPVETRRQRLDEYHVLLREALRRAGPPSSAARRRRRALLEAELAWCAAERALVSAEGGAPSIAPLSPPPAGPAERPATPASGSRSARRTSSAPSGRSKP